jgi:hypothetical protein
MRIIETPIPDFHEESIDKSKVLLGQKIIDNISPLLNQAYLAKVEYKKKLQEEIKTEKKKIDDAKREVQQIINDYNRKKKVARILDRINKLVETGLIHDSQLRHETVILLKILDKLPEDKLDLQLNRTIEVLNKRFSRS